MCVLPVNSKGTSQCSTRMPCTVQSGNHLRGAAPGPRQMPWKSRLILLHPSSPPPAATPQPTQNESTLLQTGRKSRPPWVHLHLRAPAPTNSSSCSARIGAAGAP